VAPQVFFELLLPISSWNGKFLELGCGGACGRLPDPAYGGWCPLHRGYACISSDTGHEGGDSLWAYNNPQAQMDFGSRATHVASVVGKAITAHYYGRAPQYSYFQGCSLGMQQGLVEAQRFPGDFDGIVGGGVWIGDIDSSMDFIWGARALRGADGKPIVTPADMQRVHQAVLAACDMDDGVKDGLVGNPRSCKFDPAQLLCTSSRNGRCLTAMQVEAVKKVYSGPMTSSGVKLSLGGPFPGGEQDWIVEPGGALGAGDWIMSDGGSSVPELWANTQFHGLVLPPGRPGWKISDLDFDRDYRRFSNGAKESFIHESNPDLRKFKAVGGKLMLYVGWKEWADPRKAIDYYETVERTMGGPGVTRDFFKLYMIPGANHCIGGEGAWAIDYLTYMEGWVERGQAPDKLIGAHIVSGTADIAKLHYPLDPAIPVDFTRPVYPYPLWAKFAGRGDPNKAQNFKPESP